MTYSKAINNNFIFSICASRVILLINLGHDGVQFITNLFIPPFLPQRWDKRLDLNKTFVHGSSKFSGSAFDKASFAARSASSFPVISPWLGSQQNVINLPLDNISWYACKTLITRGFLPWWRHQMETFSALLAICAGNSPVPGEFPTQRPVTRSFDVYFDLRPNKQLSKQWRGWWFETPSWSLWRHRNALLAFNGL